MKTVVFFIGKAQNGKDTAYELTCDLAKEYGFQKPAHYAFATILKEEAKNIGWSGSKSYTPEEQKIIDAGEHFITDEKGIKHYIQDGRAALQHISVPYKDLFGPDYYTEMTYSGNINPATLRNCEARDPEWRAKLAAKGLSTRGLIKEPNGSISCISDMRFKSEEEFFRQGAEMDLATRGMKYVFIKIVRPENRQWHSPLTEKQKQDRSETELEQITPDYTIINDGTLKDFKNKLLDIYLDMAKKNLLDPAITSYLCDPETVDIT